MGHKQTAGEYITHEVALELIRHRLDAGQPVGANDLRALGVSLATDRYKLALRIALAERGLRRRPRVRGAAGTNASVSGVPRAQSVDADTPSPLLYTPAPQVPTVAVDQGALPAGGPTDTGASAPPADQRIIRRLFSRIVSLLAAAPLVLRAAVRAAMSTNSLSQRR
jgi:hypothetical protein